jgi:thioredoxin 1
MVKVLKFSAAWCGPCKTLSPVFEQIKGEISGVNYIDIDVDTNKAMAQAYSITSIPAVIIEKDGEVANKIIGLKPKSAYTQAIKELL